MDRKNQKTITTCIIGKPNAGKSSLLNKLINEKISIVTPKVQTTRSIITGIITYEDTQIIIFDTSGIFEPKRQLERAMVRCAWSSLNSANLVMVIIDSGKPMDKDLTAMLNRLDTLKIIPVFLLNKIDLYSPHHQQLTEYLLKNNGDSRIFDVSALTGKGIDALMDYISSQAINMPWLYEKDDLTNLPVRFLAEEITREQLFLQLHQELPYHVTVRTEQWQELSDKSVKIHQAIIVSRNSYKTIILGKKGSKIKEIGLKARLEMEEFLNHPVHLFLFVKVRESWEETPDFYHHMGLKFTKS